MQILLISCFGVFGILGRYLIQMYGKEWNCTFPIATFFINILGSFLIGYVYSSSTQYSWLTHPVRLALMVGLIGGFTTFSAFSLDTLLLLKNGQYISAISYVFGSVVLSLLATMAGLKLAVSQ